MNFNLAGTYQISLSAAQRANYGSSKEQVQVLVDGTAVGTIIPTSTTYFSYTTGSFSVTSGSHTITFVGVDPSGADYSAFLDQVSINNVSPAGFTDPGFEYPSLGRALQPTSMIRQARRGASAARRASRATAVTSPRAIPTPRRAARSPSFRGLARSARP